MGLPRSQGGVGIELLVIAGPLGPQAGPLVLVRGASVDGARPIGQADGVPTKRTGRRRVKAGTSGSGKGGSVRTTPKGPADYVRDLVAANYFKTKRGLGDVQEKLEEAGHIYAVTYLSPVLLRSVRAKELRRIIEGGTWKYVNP